MITKVFAAAASIAVLALCPRMVAAQSAAPQNPAAPTGTIRGRVVAADTGKPLKRARLLLRLAVAPAGGAGPIAATTTNASGQFELNRIAAGSYRLIAGRAGYLEVEYGQRRTREPGVPLELKAAGLLDRLEVRLPRTSVIAGTVTDERGEPYPGVRVDAYELRYSGGRRLPAQAEFATTDDRGQYRITGLQPGSYYVAVTATDAWIGPDGATFGYQPRFFPGTSAEQAQMITLALGAQKVDVSFPLIGGRTARVAGHLLNAAGGAIAGESVVLASEVSIRATNIGSVVSGRDGSFEFRNVAPGNYRLNSSGMVNGRPESGVLRVSIAGADVTDLSLVRSGGSTVSGVLATDDGVSPPFALTTLRINGLTESGSGFRTFPVAADGTFVMPDVMNAVLIRINGLPDGWMLKGIGNGEKDVPEGYLDVPRGKNITTLRLTVTSRAGRLSGDVVVDASSKPTADATVVVFPEDESLWARGSRYLRTARPNPDGHFSINGLPAGRYRVVAKEYVEDGAGEAPDYLSTLRTSASPLEIVEGGSPAVTLKVQP